MVFKNCKIVMTYNPNLNSGAIFFLLTYGILELTSSVTVCLSSQRRLKDKYPFIKHLTKVFPC